MKQIFALVLTAILTVLFISCGQTASDNISNSSAENDESFASGNNVNNTNGTAMGYLHLINDRDTLVIDFNSTELTLTIDDNANVDNVYLARNYSAPATDEKASIKYQTYALSNILSIVLNGTKYSSGVFDDEKDIQVSGLSVNYVSEKNIEYLSFYLTEPLLLSTAYQFPKTQGNEHESYKPVKAITVLPGSNIIFRLNK